jgi:hypothetical protein
MNNQLEEFHTPDSMWEVWNINSHKDFIDKYMVKGKFHSNVPDEIQKEFEVVERLLCYSYYSYPLIDEAFSKATRTFEAAVKKRLEVLDISIKKNASSLNQMLEKLEQHTSPQLITEWHKARRVRNIFAHPNPGQLFGITVFRSFIQMVNILNTLFLDKKQVEKNEALLAKLKQETSSYNNGLYKLEIDDKAFLVWSIIPHYAFKTKNGLKSFWVFHPVLTYFPQTSDKLDFSLPICLRLEKVKYSKNKIVAINLKDNKTIKVSLTDKIENKNALAKHKTLLGSCDIEVRKMYWHFLDTELANEIVKFIYHECWN